MAREIEYNLVVISDAKNNKYFVSKVPWFSKLNGVALIYNFTEFKSKNTGECPYKKLVEHVKDNFASLVCCRYPDKKSKEDIESLIYKYQLKLVEKHGDECILNDMIINPKKVQCSCGQMVHEQFLESHKSKYCVANNLPSIEELLEL